MRWTVAAATLLGGIVVLVVGVYLETRNPRSNAEDDFAWCLLAVGVSMLGTGISIPFVRPLWVAVVALGLPFVAYVLAVSAFWGWVVIVGDGN